MTSTVEVILIFASNADAMIATKALKDAGIPVKMIPKPAGVDSSANLCLSIEAASEPLASTTLSAAGIALGGVVR
ncbi:MAG: DUF3343 domain-containing protein [Candidatus Tyrphobacter sp.]